MPQPVTFQIEDANHLTQCEFLVQYRLATSSQHNLFLCRLCGFAAIQPSQLISHLINQHEVILDDVIVQRLAVHQMISGPPARGTEAVVTTFLQTSPRHNLMIPREFTCM